jgi:hypothetical protein
MFLHFSIIVLVGLRDYQDDKADIILKYMPNEVRLFKAYRELPETTRLNEGIAAGLVEEDEGVGSNYVVFEDVKLMIKCLNLSLSINLNFWDN